MGKFKIGIFFFALASGWADATALNDSSKLLTDNTARTAAVINFNQQRMLEQRQLVKDLTKAEATAMAASRRSPNDFAARRAYERARDQRIQAEKDLRKQQGQDRALRSCNEQNTLAAWARSDSGLSKGQVLALAAGVGVVGGAIGMAIGSASSAPASSGPSTTVLELRAAAERRQRAQQAQFDQLARSIDRYAASQSAKIVTTTTPPPSTQLAVIPATLPRY